MLRTVAKLSLGLAVLGVLAVSQAAHADVAIPHKEPRPEDVSSIDGIVKAYYEVVSGPAQKDREWGRDATL